VATTTSKPGAGAFHHPTCWSPDKPWAPGGTPHHCQAPLARCCRVDPRVERMILACVIGPDYFQARRGRGRQRLQHPPGGHRVIDAARLTMTANSSPQTSTLTGRLRPWMFLPPSSPRSPPCSVVCTDWLSRLAALVVDAFAGACGMRTVARRASIMCCHVPSWHHGEKSSQTVRWESRSCGRMSPWQPVRLRERRVLRTSRLSTSRGRPPGLAGRLSGGKMAHGSSGRSVRSG
jgi:hypothetical protein